MRVWKRSKVTACDDGARLLTLSAPSGFADFVRAAGQAASSLDLPAAAPIDVERLAALAEPYGNLHRVGPPPD